MTEQQVNREFERLALLTIIVKGFDSSDKSKDAKFVRKDLKDALDRCTKLRTTSLPA